MVTPLLVHRVGSGSASYMLLSGERVSSSKALQLGLIHDVVDDGGLDKRINALTTAILSGSRSALGITKTHINACTGTNITELIRESIDVSALARATDDAREGLAAFLEKRKPAWQSE